MTHDHTYEGTHAGADTQQKSTPSDTAAQSPIDKMVAAMTRTLEEIQRDPLLHHKLSQRGF
ncbi:hypothetical protein [Luteimonas saliphila]|uniref:hypothetical protein n=1 Tax=Luteimonas saliphila TaxID=2804919 RepID=UPI00192D3F2A|nr:hypothetical protein [Luteimonas saliphila]